MGKMSIRDRSTGALGGLLSDLGTVTMWVRMLPSRREWRQRVRLSPADQKMHVAGCPSTTLAGRIFVRIDV